MTTSTQWQRTLDAVVELAEEIARLAPDCADRAVQIVRLIRAVDPPDRELEEDALAVDDVLDGPDVGPLRRSRPADLA
ncbi:MULTISPECIES: hypothetical protein [Methylobacterium]|uniref:Uncharacterized protein n=3 Tax=Methylobacterium TaxID=407 RepID=A0A0C6FBC1_9HYPH|nr:MULTISPECIES: hypothetical protein [Methylobacterium]MBZ6416889.1 hypothetical protein [Methylobacterium sp.]MBK3398353.1 hypothetical protein [Methylobacterium ajmalii]MBK3410492.1 hypothetical protein [Methylobacterium ajmalii]MBK3426183.1 hypothetical protein [Methylobacterium ajmalii]SFE94484.1 hypothetical protein SAMN04487844_1082 [Methylobacterium sp. yr596]